MLVAMVRRSLWLVLLAAAGGAGYSWWRDRADADTLATPEWPPLPASSSTTANSTSAEPTNTGPTNTEPTTLAPSTSDKSANSEKSTESAAPKASPTTSIPSPQAPTGSSATGTATASFVNALVDAPEARSSDGNIGGWVDALDDGSCPISHPIKANDNSGIFHVPGGRFYDRTKPERCYTGDDAAIADGYRRAKN